MRWIAREARHGWPARKVGLTRLVVPLDPWRYYELGRIADETFSGICLDVSSPKLLPSLLQREGAGRWVCIDLFADEIAAWRTVDPALELDVQDATALSFADGTFDNCMCVSVLEHVGKGKDRDALAEIWRVLKPGGVLHLTTDVEAAPRDVFVTEKVYGEASRSVAGEGVFFKHAYGTAEVEELIANKPWRVRHREYAVQRKPGIERWFYAHAPWSYVAGPFLRFACAENFDVRPTSVLVDHAGEGVVYLQLEKPDESVT
ncbi:MAG: class I SAM-dependent methyltransferase [Gaiellaceae bacterium]